MKTSFNTAFTSIPRSSKWPHYVFGHNLHIYFSSLPIHATWPAPPRGSSCAIFTTLLSPDHPDPRSCATPCNFSFYSKKLSAFRLNPNFEEARLPAVRQSLLHLYLYNVLNIIHTVEIMSVCLPVYPSSYWNSRTARRIFIKFYTYVALRHWNPLQSRNTSVSCTFL
jgi:hypothetical protein